MKQNLICAATLALAFVAGGCHKVPPPAISEADASAAADATQTVWTSMDAAKIEALYTKNVVGFDPAIARLSTDRANWDKLQMAFADMKFDGITVFDRKIQILDADTFVASGTATMTSKDGTIKSSAMRFTDVYQKQADGKWLIANEHVSFVPKAAG